MTWWTSSLLAHAGSERPPPSCADWTSGDGCSYQLPISALFAEGKIVGASAEAGRCKAEQCIGAVYNAGCGPWSVERLRMLQADVLMC